MIAIKDMEIPKNCNECPYSCDYCALTGEWVSDTEQIRDKNCPLLEIVTCKDCKQWKDSDGVYRRGLGAESKCPINTKEVCEGNFYCADAERRE